jgi:hypothetical protein
MANVLRIKRRAVGGAAGAPAALAAAELAFNEVDDTLYYGKGDNAGAATSIIAIAGSGSVVTISGIQTITGNKTFSGTVVLGASASATTPAGSDNSTTVATTAFVKAQGYISGNQSVTLSGDVTGTGATAITTTIAAGVVTNAKMANVATATIKGRSTAGTGSPEDLTATQVKTLLAIAASDVSGFDTQVRTNRLDQMALPTASVNLNNQKITGLATPTLDTDAATKAYVDAARSGLDVKDSVRVATTTNITLSGTQTIDGVSVIAGDRVLVKDQTTASGNGIYVCAAGAWARAADAADNAEVTSGMFTFVSEGTLNSDTGWVLTTNDVITLGTTSLAFSQFSGAGAVTAGAGMTKTGNTLDVATASASRIVVNADNIDLASGVITTPGTYKSVTIDTYGRATAGTNPTTLAGFGISDGQPLDATLTALAGTTVAANKLIYATAADTFTTTDFSAFGRSLVDDADAAAGRTTLGLGTMATQAASAVAITGGTIDGITFDGGTF